MVTAFSANPVMVDGYTRLAPGRSVASGGHVAEVAGMSDDARASDAVMGRQEARDYWDTRHGAEADLRSGGNIGLSEEGNELIYSLRVGRLIEVLEYESAPTAPLRILDAGCGKGYFSRALASFGHEVDGIDTSNEAISDCLEQAHERESFAVSSLAEWCPPHLYDVVVCIDVLFHILDDEEWQASVRNLGSLVRVGGRLVLADHGADQDRVWARHQKTRASSRYQGLLADLGFTYLRFVPNGLPGADVGFHLATKVA
jgi:2-polyprenyl-3-methyl-5-hydroxy-6-metoxy-1,4-benzoquinol methylase